MEIIEQIYNIFGEEQVFCVEDLQYTIKLEHEEHEEGIYLYGIVIDDNDIKYVFSIKNLEPNMYKAVRFLSNKIKEINNESRYVFNSFIMMNKISVSSNNIEDKIGDIDLGTIDIGEGLFSMFEIYKHLYMNYSLNYDELHKLYRRLILCKI